jgi:hypothetical protein
MKERVQQEQRRGKKEGNKIDKKSKNTKRDKTLKKIKLTFIGLII